MTTTIKRYQITYYEEKHRVWWYLRNDHIWQTDKATAGKWNFDDARKLRDSIDQRLSPELKVVREVE